jgi:hypothetical protein
MFVYSVQSKHIKVLSVGLFVVFTLVSLVVLSRESKQTSSDGSLNLKASTHQERMSFLSQFDWEVNEEPVEIKEIIIPATFDETYTAYNEIQKAQGFDLTEYADVRVKRWTYTVKNYEGYENSECIHANILVHDGIVIGGDICSVELDGFMHGFSKP